MISIWEKHSFLDSDIIIIGAGITGLSAAASLKEKQPSLKVTVLEKGVLPSGASTKNAGFACFGSVTELLSDISVLGSDGMVRLVEKRWSGLQKTIKRLSANKIDLKIQGGYELLTKDHIPEEKLHEVNEALYPLFLTQVFQFSNEKIRSFGFNETSHLIENKLEGQLDTGKLMTSLWDYCTSLGVRIHTGVNVTEITENEHKVIVTCAEQTFSAKQMGICSNGFTKKLLVQDLDIQPGRGLVLSILPRTPLKFKGTFQYNEGYYYFRDYNNRLIFGGGRNIDFKSETTTEFGVNEKIKQRLISDLNTMILPDQEYEIEMEWSGIMAFGKTKEPIVERISEKQVIGVRLGGMGVAIGSLVGEQVAFNLLQ